MAIILLTISALIVGVVSFYLWTWTYWRRRGIDGPIGYPFIGIALQMLDAEHPPYLQLREWTKQYGKVFGMTEGLAKIMVISDPDLVHEVFVKQYDNFYGRKLNPIQGDPNKDKRVNLFAAQGHRWKRLRNISSPTFSNSSLRKLKSTVEESAVELLRHIEEQTAGGQQIDMLEFYQEFTLDVIGRIAMGQTDTQMFKNPMLPFVKRVFGEPRKFIFLTGGTIPGFGKIMRKILMNYPSLFSNPVIYIFKQMEKAAGIEPGEPADFIDLFLDARADVDMLAESNDDFTKAGVKVSRQLTTDEIVGQCFVFLIAGFDTTALSLSYSTYLLATNPLVMAKLQEEVDRECPDPEITFDQLAKLKYMEMVIKETLRLYPLGALANSRKCMRSTRIGEFDVEEGVEIMCDTWTLHYDPNIWGADAESFRPERWEGAAEQHKSGGYIPFGLGPRQCIGMRLAYMEEKLLLAHLLRKYTFQPGARTRIPLKLVGRATTQPDSVWMHLKARE
ncbi:unnamed protein product [Caenorhabditis sp. 36 PRJEB53466]|nr:unnamed protein product [Caenorhabditis sp. 36 PRJEB53466]